MTNLILPKQYHPEFLLPDVKPGCDLVIDEKNEFAEGLELLIIPQLNTSILRDGSGSNGDDSGPPLINLASSLNHASVWHSFGGRGFVPDIINGQVCLSQEQSSNARLDIYGDVPSFTNSEAWTIAGSCIAPSADVNIWPIGGFSLGSSIRNRRGTSLNFAGDSDSFNIAPGFTANTGQATTVVTTDGLGAASSTLTAYQIETNESLAASSKSTDVTFSTLFDTGINDVENIIYWAVWRGRHFSKEQAFRFGQAPYQVLKPANEPTYTFPSASGTILPVDSGTFSTVGTAVGLIADRIVAAASGTFSYTGTAVTLSFGQILAVDPGAFAYVGTAVDLKVSMVADSGTFSYLGTEVDLNVGHVVVVDSGSYAYIGTAVDLNQGRVLVADSGSFSLVGTEVDLLEAGDSTIIVDSGTFLLNGTAVNLLRDLELPVDSGTYSYAGTDAGLKVSYILSTDSGSYSYTGTNIDFVQNQILVVESGTFLLTGTPVGLVSSESGLAVAVGFNSLISLNAGFSGLIRLNAAFESIINQ